MNIDESHGFFPNAMPNSFIKGLMIGGELINFTHVNNLQSKSLINTGKAFNSFDVDDNDDRKISKKNENEDNGDAYPDCGNLKLGLSFAYSSVLPFYLLFETAYNYKTDLLNYTDKSKGFVDYDGKYKTLKEMGIVSTCEHQVSFQFGIRQPIYGGYFKLNEQSVESIYYLDILSGINYSFSSKTTQYMQLSNYNDKIRYDNGYDTLNLMTEQKLQTLNQMRTYLEFGLGWMIQSSGFGTDFGISYIHAVSSVIADDRWKQNSLMFNFRVFF